MISTEAAPLVIDTARNFISFIREIAPDWKEAYLRFSKWDSVSESKASYAHSSVVEIVDVLKYKGFFQSITQSGSDLLAAMEKAEGVFLLIVKSNFDYEIKFEYADSEKWRISKLDGGTGVPEGIE